VKKLNARGLLKVVSGTVGVGVNDPIRTETISLLRSRNR
jgi:hypothetical protein